MSKKQIVGLTGFAGAGKDTVADLLVTHCGFVKIAFADSLRDEICRHFDIDLRFLTNPATKHHPITALSMRRAPIIFVAAVLHALGTDAPRTGTDEWNAWLSQPRSPRQIMQWWGTEFRRAEHPHYWSRRTLQHMVNLMRDGSTRIVVSDCRFANEIDTVRVAGGKIWQVTRPGLDRSSTTEGAHISVTDGAEFAPDLILPNIHNIAHLQQLVLSEAFAHQAGIQGLKVTVPA